MNTLIINFDAATGQAISGTYNGGTIEEYNYISNGVSVRLPEHIILLINYLNTL